MNGAAAEKRKEGPTDVGVTSKIQKCVTRGKKCSRRRSQYEWRSCVMTGRLQQLWRVAEQHGSAHGAEETRGGKKIEGVK